MTDVLYILGRGSRLNDLELRLSLRCLEKNASNVGKVFIVGNCPEWAQNIYHLSVEDTYQAWSNHFRKVYEAIDNGISDNFLLMNDDFYMMKPFDASTYPYYIRKQLFSDKQNGIYKMMLENTVELLNKKGIDKPLAYNCHVPFIYNKDKFLELKLIWEEHKRSEIGYSPRLLYGNLFVGTGIEIDDPKVFNDVLPEIGISGCVSSHSNSIQMLKELEKIFNKPSKYEKEKE